MMFVVLINKDDMIQASEQLNCTAINCNIIAICNTNMILQSTNNIAISIAKFQNIAIYIGKLFLYCNNNNQIAIP